MDEDSRIRCTVSKADVIFIAVDNKENRRLIEEFCRSHGVQRYLSCGVSVEPENGGFGYECTWKPDSSRSTLGVQEGYGEKNGSFASIVVEAASVAFTMLLSHMKNENSSFTKCSRQYDQNFQLVQKEN